MNELKEWTKNYLKHKDLILERIKSMADKSEDILEVDYGDHKTEFIMNPDNLIASFISISRCF